MSQMNPKEVFHNTAYSVQLSRSLPLIKQQYQKVSFIGNYQFSDENQKLQFHSFCPNVFFSMEGHFFFNSLPGAELVPCWPRISMVS